MRSRRWTEVQSQAGRLDGLPRGTRCTTGVRACAKTNRAAPIPCPQQVGQHCRTCLLFVDHTPCAMPSALPPSAHPAPRTRVQRARPLVAQDAAERAEGPRAVSRPRHGGHEASAHHIQREAHQRGGNACGRSTEGCGWRFKQAAGKRTAVLGLRSVVWRRSTRGATWLRQAAPNGNNPSRRLPKAGLPT